MYYLHFIIPVLCIIHNEQIIIIIENFICFLTERVNKHCIIFNYTMLFNNFHLRFSFCHHFVYTFVYFPEMNENEFEEIGIQYFEMRISCK
jgi:hypothetical protein